MAALDFISNIYFWILMALTFMLLAGFLMILLIVLAKKTHAIIELKAWLGGKPIGLFFQDTGYVEWDAVKVDAGIIEHKQYGAQIVNEKGSYIDRKTKSIMIPFTAGVAPALNIHAAKIADDLMTILKSREQMDILRSNLAQGDVKGLPHMDILKTSVHLGSIKSFMNAITPHAVTAKIEKTVSAQMRNSQQQNAFTLLLVGGGALLLGVVMAVIIMKQGGA